MANNGVIIKPALMHKLLNASQPQRPCNTQLRHCHKPRGGATPSGVWWSDILDVGDADGLTVLTKSYRIAVSAIRKLRIGNFIGSVSIVRGVDDV